MTESWGDATVFIQRRIFPTFESDPRYMEKLTEQVEPTRPNTSEQ